MYYVESVEDIVVELATQLHAATHLHAINTTCFFFCSQVLKVDRNRPNHTHRDTQTHASNCTVAASFPLSNSSN